MVASDLATAESDPARETLASSSARLARLVMRSRYLIGVAMVILLYEMVSNIVDFQLSATVQLAIDQDRHARRPGERYRILVGQDERNWLEVQTLVFQRKFCPPAILAVAPIFIA